MSTKKENDKDTVDQFYGNRLFREQKFDLAIDSYYKSLDLNPDSAQAYFGLAKALINVHKVSEAIAAYQQAIEYEDDLDEKGKIYHWLGAAFIEQGEIDKAIASSQKAVELNPKVAHFHRGFGYAMQSKGKIDEAIAAFQKSIELDSNYKLAHKQLKNALRKKKQSVKPTDLKPGKSGKVKKFLVYGNCQARHIANLLIRNSEFSNEYDPVFVDPVHKIRREEIPELLNLLSQIDLFIYQPISDSYGGDDFLDKDSISYLSTHRIINQVLKRDCLTLSFPSIYFSGYLPNTIYVRRANKTAYKGPGWDYHDSNIIESYVKGLSLNQALEIISTDCLYSIDEIRKDINISFQQLRTRESKFSLDIRISDFIQSNLLNQRLFHTFNHPSVDLLIFVTSQILNRLKFTINDSDFCSYPDVHGKIYFPIHPSVYKILGLKFCNPMNYRIRIDGNNRLIEYNKQPKKENIKLVSAREAIKIFYRFYDKHEECVELYRNALSMERQKSTVVKQKSVERI